MIEDYGINLWQMMENAGRSLAALARRRFLNGDPRGKRVIVLAGTGGNGGGGLVGARRLHNWGAEVQVYLTRPPEAYTGVPAQQLAILQRLPLRITVGADDAEWAGAAVIIDAVIGYSLAGPPRGTAAALILRANTCGSPILALDTPSGLDAGSGIVYDPAIKAMATLTLALPKAGLKAAPDHVGELYLADISVPRELYAGPGLGLAVGPIFAEDDIIRVEW